jgi:hypothetical protein
MKQVIFKPSQISQFNVLPFQRKAEIRKDLLDSIKKHGVITSITAIYSTAITGKRELFTLDGGHRLLCYSFLDKSFPVVILDDENDIATLVEKMAVINSSQHSWTLYNYIDVYCHLNYPDYKTLNNLMQKTGLSPSCLGTMLIGYSPANKYSYIGKHIKRGEFKISSLDVTNDTIKLLKELPSTMTTAMIIAFHWVRLTNDNFEFNIFKDKLNKNIKSLIAEKYSEFTNVFNSWF